MDHSKLRPAYGLALLAGVAPLWSGRHLPLVDLPQHLHLISVLHRLNDPTTLYPGVFAARGELTPYLGYYYLVSLLNWLVPLDMANRLFLTAYVAGVPLSMAFLLKSLKRPIWPSLLTVPFAYGDSLAWGFINYVSAIPLTFLCAGSFVRAIEEIPRRRLWASVASATFLAVLLFHVQAFAFLGLALGLLLLTTRAPDDPSSRPARLASLALPRRAALLALVPGMLLFAVWVVGRLGQPTEIEAGAPWKAWGPLLSAQNLAYKTFDQNGREFFPVLANMLRDGSDRYSLYWVAGVCVLATFVWVAQPRWRQATEQGLVGRLRLPLLATTALILYFTLPFDIRGYMYYLNTRFAHLAAPLLVACVPALDPRASRLLTWLAAATSLVLGIPMARATQAFNEEAAGIDRLIPATGDKPTVMGLLYDPSSRVVSHPVFLHSSTMLAMARGGATNFSFARTPHSPIKYRGEPPPTFPSEWRPDQFNYSQQGRAYDHFLLRGVAPEQVFGNLLETELVTVAREGTFTLVRRR